MAAHSLVQRVKTAPKDQDLIDRAAVRLDAILSAHQSAAAR